MKKIILLGMLSNVHNLLKNKEYIMTDKQIDIDKFPTITDEKDLIEGLVFVLAKFLQSTANKMKDEGMAAVGEKDTASLILGTYLGEVGAAYVRGVTDLGLASDIARTSMAPVFEKTDD